MKTKITKSQVLIPTNRSSTTLIDRIISKIDIRLIESDRTHDGVPDHEKAEIVGQLMALSEGYGADGFRAIKVLAETLNGVPNAAYKHDFPGFISRVDEHRIANRGNLPDPEVLRTYAKTSFTDQRVAALSKSYGSGSMHGGVKRSGTSTYGA